MKRIKLLLVLVFISFSAKAQIVQKDTIKMGYVLTENDTILNDTILLPEIIISREKLDLEAKKQFLILQLKVLHHLNHQRLNFSPFWLKFRSF